MITAVIGLLENRRIGSPVCPGYELGFKAVVHVLELDSVAASRCTT